jgi:hypothetical protein
MWPGCRRLAKEDFGREAPTSYRRAYAISCPARFPERDHLLMDQDDPEQRIAELEHQLAEQKRGADLPQASLGKWGRRAAAKTRSSVRSGRMRAKRVSRAASRPMV